MVGDATIGGYVFNDLNDNGLWDQGGLVNEPGVAGMTLYLDLNNNGVFDPGEPTAVTQADDLGTRTSTRPATTSSTTSCPGRTSSANSSRTTGPIRLGKDWIQTYPYTAATAAWGTPAF